MTPAVRRFADRTPGLRRIDPSPHRIAIPLTVRLTDPPSSSDSTLGRARRPFDRRPGGRRGLAARMRAASSTKGLTDASTTQRLAQDARRMRGVPPGDRRHRLRRSDDGRRRTPARRVRRLLGRRPCQGLHREMVRPTEGEPDDPRGFGEPDPPGAERLPSLDSRFGDRDRELLPHLERPDGVGGGTRWPTCGTPPASRLSSPSWRWPGRARTPARRIRRRSGRAR